MGESRDSVAPHPLLDGQECWTEKRALLHDWIHEQSEALAELYLGALILLYCKSIPGAVISISFAVCEIGEGLPSIAADSEGYTGRRSREALAHWFFIGRERANWSVEESLRPMVEAWLNVLDWFRQYAYGSNEVHCDPPEVRRQFQLFESSLLSVAQPFFATLNEIDGILDRANARK